MNAYTDGETGTDSKRHQHLSAHRELQRLIAAYRDSHREACSCIQRERLRERDAETDRKRDRQLDTESDRYIEGAQIYRQTQTEAGRGRQRQRYACIH